jgi:hypothetical protein
MGADQQRPRRIGLLIQRTYYSVHCIRYAIMQRFYRFAIRRGNMDRVVRCIKEGEMLF